MLEVVVNIELNVRKRDKRWEFSQILCKGELCFISEVSFSTKLATAIILALNALNSASCSHFYFNGSANLIHTKTYNSPGSSPFYKNNFVFWDCCFLRIMKNYLLFKKVVKYCSRRSISKKSPAYQSSDIQYAGPVVRVRVLHWPPRSLNQSPHRNGCSWLIRAVYAKIRHVLKVRYLTDCVQSKQQNIPQYLNQLFVITMLNCKKEVLKHRIFTAHYQ